MSNRRDALPFKFEMKKKQKQKNNQKALDFLKI